MIALLDMQAQQLSLLADDADRTSDERHGGPTARAVVGADELQLVHLAVELGAAELGGPLSGAERQLLELAESVGPSSAVTIERLRAAIRQGDDPLGEMLCRLRPGARRRTLGAFYTPRELTEPMLDWVLAGGPDRLVDPGCGSGRFAAEAIRRQPELPVVAVDIDPMATLLSRATLAVLEARGATVLQADYTRLRLPVVGGRTAFVGNPPYVRHHALTPAQKAWAVRVGQQLGYRVSGLAGLHAHFFLATALLARPGDIGSFVTSSEWLDVNYGAIIRDLLLDGLGGEALHVLDPRSVPFEDAMTTTVITCFDVGSSPSSVRFSLVRDGSELRDLSGGREVNREIVQGAKRWSPLLRAPSRSAQAGPTVPLRTVARVHRGVVTGANDFFVLSSERARELGLEQWCRPAITSAEEIFEANGVVWEGPARRLLLVVPPEVDRKAHPALNAYLRSGEQAVGPKAPISGRYITSHRRPWWYVGRSTAPPIVVSYMARRPPVFALNPDGLLLLNIAHGLYPVGDLGEEQVEALANYLNGARESFAGAGRTYHGGLEKFEPSEMEALHIPASGAWMR